MSETLIIGNAKVYKDIPYKTDSSLKLDIYVPNVETTDVKKPDDGWPVVVYGHGSGWLINTKDNSYDNLSKLSEKGYAVVVMDYSKSFLDNQQLTSILTLVIFFMLLFAFTSSTVEQTIFILVIMVVIISYFCIVWATVPREKNYHPKHIMDIAEAFKWSYDNISNYNGNNKMIFAAGHSSGSMLTSLLSTNEMYIEQQGLKLTDIKGCVAISPPLSDVRMKESGIGSELLYAAFGRKDDYSDAFPIWNVEPGKGIPPFLLINAESDLNLKRSSLDFHYLLKQNNIYSKIFYLDGANHWNECRYWDGDHKIVLDTIHQFLQECIEYNNSN